MKKLVCAVVALVCGVSLAADLRWVNWDGDLKASTAANWEPAQVPQTGDNLTIFYNGSGIKNWYNDLDIVYGHITVVLTNTTDTRVDFYQKEVRVTDGFSVIGQGGTFYPRTAITGTGDFEVDCHGGSVSLPTSPTSGNVYSGNFIIRTGGLTPGAANVLGDEHRHGYVYLYAPSVTAGKSGSLNFSGSWTMWNDIYYDNTSSQYALAPSSAIRYEGKMYFRGGGGTIQHPSGGNPICFYGKWVRWAPEGAEKNTSVLNLYGRNPGFIFYGGYEDDMAPMTLWNDASIRVKISSQVYLPYGILLKGGGQVTFGIDDVSDTPLPLSLANGSVVDFAGTSQKIGDITVAANTTPTLKDSVGGGEIVWSPTKDSTLVPVPEGNVSLTLDAEGLIGTLGSSTLSGAVGAKAGTLVIAAGAELPNVTGWTIAKDATLDVRSSALSANGILRMEEGATLTIASDVTLTVLKAFRGGVRMSPGRHTFGDGTLEVLDPVFVWTGAAGDGNLGNRQNWNYGELPAADDNAILSSDGPLALTGTLEVLSLTIGEGTEIALGSGSVLSAGSYVFGEGAQIVSESATLEFTGSGTYAAFPISEGVAVRVAKGTLTFAADAEIPNLKTLSVAAGATLDIRSPALPTDGVLELDADATLTIAQGTVFTVFKAFVGGERLDNGDYTYGDGTLRVHPVYTWTGAAGDGDLANPANWAYGELPGAAGDAVISAAEPLDLHGTLTVKSLTLDAGTVVNLAAGSVLSAEGYAFGEGAKIVSEAATLEFTGTSTCADLPVSSGVTVKVSAGTVTFAFDRIGGGNLNLETYAAEGVAVAAGVTVSVYTLKVNGEYVNPGEVVAGGGRLAVYTKPVDPAEEWSVWTGGAGEGNKSIFADANWEGGTAPDLASGTAKLRFPAGAEVEIPSGVARAYQLDLQGAFTTTGEGSLAVGAGGAVVAAADVTFGTRVDFTATPQRWLLDGKDAKITFAGPLGSRADGDVAFLGNGDAKIPKGIGNVIFLSACAEAMTAGVIVSNLLTDVKHGEALGRERGLSVWAKGYNYTNANFGPHLFQTGLVVKFPVRFYGHRYELTSSTSGSTDNVLTFDEPVWFYCDPDLSGTAVSLTCRARYTFNAPVWTEKGANSCTACMSGEDYGIFFNDTLTLEGSNVDGRYYAAGANGWLHLAKPVTHGGDIFAINASGVHIDCRGENVLDSRKGVIFYFAGGTFHLNGNDQSVQFVWPNFTIGPTALLTVDSQDDVAVLRLTNPFSNYKNGDQPLVCTGKAGVEFAMAQSTQTCTLKYGVSNTRGPLIVSSGTLAFDEGAKWCGRGTVRIASGAKVQTGAADVFGSAELGHKVGLEIAAGGVLDLGANQSMRYFIHDGKDMEPGTYGAPGSGAAHEMDCFAGTGILIVTSVPKPGIVLLVR